MSLLLALQTAGGPVNYADSLLVGNYAVSGKAITDSVAKEDSLSVGNYVVSGKSITDLLAKNDNLSAGSYAVSGKAITDSVVRSDSLAAGNYTVSGKAITDVVARIDSLAVGNYVVSGKDITDVITSVSGINYTDDLLVGAYLVSGIALNDEIIVAEISGAEGFGNWYGKERKKKIRFVRKLTKELEQIEEQIDAVEEIKPELVIYENLVYQELLKEFDDQVKTAISDIDRLKTEKILNEIQSKVLLKQAQLAEEQDIIFAFISML